MADREKVIKGLHDARRYLEDKEWSDRGASPHIDAINDALTMLKEQEHKDRMFHALEDDWKRLKELLKEQKTVVHPEPSCEMKYITDCCCDLCGVQLIREDNFCRSCGKPIDWSK